MKLKKITLKNLNQKITIKKSLFDEDINIITGMNGSGKTTFLKIVWYTISGNIERIIPEIMFDSFELETSDYTVALHRTNEQIRWSFVSVNIKKERMDECGEFEIDPESQSFDKETHKLNLLVTKTSKSSSLYFPTFRRIEGGYSMANTRRIRRKTSSGQIFVEAIERDDIQNSFDAMSHRLSVEDHKFICSTSTNDLVSLLTDRYAEASEESNKTYLNFSTSIISKIESAKSDIDKKDQEDSLKILTELQIEASNVNQKCDDLLKPFEVLSRLTSKILEHKGIKLKSVTLGDSIDAIDSGVLSAGEKQMLSFLCYNAFAKNSVVFIDEPELSLHPDWQRRLFPTLLTQQSNNQFIIATHSPFIYSKYQDKEIMLSEEKGE